MKFIGKKEHISLAPGASEIIGYNVARYLGGKTGVTISSVEWSSDPTGLSFSGATTSTNEATVLVTVPTSADPAYRVKGKFTFSDGAVRTACALMRIVCD